MKATLLAALILVSVTTSAQQTTRPAAAPRTSTVQRSNASAMPASQIRDENRSSIAVIVAAGNTSLRLGTGFFVGSTGLLLTNFHAAEAWTSLV